MNLPSSELIERIERSERMYMYDRMQAIQQREGNPEGVELEWFGSALCIYSKTMPWASFNTVKGIQANQLQDLDRILSFYQDRGRKFQFEIIPSLVNAELLQELAARGFYQSGFHNSMYIHSDDRRQVWKGTADTDDVEIRRLAADEFESYATIHCRATGLPDQGIPSVARNNEVLYNRPDWRFYIAYVNKRPAAVAVMHVKEDAGSLTFAATLPEYRRQRLHQAFIHRRIQDAAEEDASLVMGQCAFLSQSHRNMEAAGMKIGYVRTTWTAAGS
ncbi:GNAT family N-acetyltransferase [Paenibacillus sp. JCM 10914]|uniref:GNAT family N-acetyltransferase n=1 Tax=Paenibacillus sp. JCM 10914 TaxID=1236974 RepID=UPI0003CC657B|nr:GNAT family N-acetyltransferase [Paenibacillus sp. JCM 10914]GAE04961.1 acetyltransferase, GNAT family [Paenibacillus sp. JCM 10914]